MLPFARMLEYGNVAPIPDYVYDGLSSDSAFTYNSLISFLSPNAPILPSSGASSFRVFKFRLKGVQYLLPSQPIAVSSYKEIYEKGMVYGTDDVGPNLYNATVAITPTVQNATYTDSTGAVYRVRLMKGTPTFNYSSSSDNPFFSPLTEFEIFTYSIYNNLLATLAPYVMFTIPSTEQIQKVVLSGTGAGTRRWAIVQGCNTSRTAPRSIGRARFDQTLPGASSYAFSQVSSNNNNPLLTETGSFWWPIFEKI